MLSVGIITFHASHNYGSMLQAYALQKTVEELGFSCEIINFRLEAQKKIYTPVILEPGGNLKTRLKKVLAVSYLEKLRIKYDKFENFLNEELRLSAREYHSLEELKADLPDYDFFIAGSDQIWNTSCPDFSWAYYLPFVKAGRKIAYAPSMGPVARQEVSNFEKIAAHVKDFDFLSVREKGTGEILEELLQTKVCRVLDPTLLLSRERWFSCFDSEPLVKGDYIFLYTPFMNGEICKIARRLSVSLRMKVVVSVFSLRYSLIYRSFHHEIAVGPWEFLNLLKNARLVCSGSFHAIVFSILFRIPFLAVQGMQDNRMRELLGKYGFEERCITLENVEQQAKNAFNMNFRKFDEYLPDDRSRSIGFLRRALSEDK